MAGSAAAQGAVRAPPWLRPAKHDLGDRSRTDRLDRYSAEVLELLDRGLLTFYEVFGALAEEAAGEDDDVFDRCCRFVSDPLSAHPPWVLSCDGPPWVLSRCAIIMQVGWSVKKDPSTIVDPGMRLSFMYWVCKKLKLDCSSPHQMIPLFIRNVRRHCKQRGLLRE